jgi:hypothetical protein
MTRLEFRNLICVLRSIDRYELVEAGVIGGMDHDTDLFAWTSFQANPYEWFVRADDDTAEKLWRLMQRRANPVLAAARAL